MQFKNWNGQSLKGLWLFSYKIDGVQATLTSKGFVTKNNNPLYNMPDCSNSALGSKYEVFCGSWNTTMSIVRASKSKRRPVKHREIYSIWPHISDRLKIGVFKDPTKELIEIAFKQALADEYEGLVLREIGTDNFIKVKPTYSEDVKITGFVEGKGKFKGMLGKFITDRGNVGTGFTENFRRRVWLYNPKSLIGTYIEVLATQRPVGKKLSHPRFIRLRPDK